MPDKKMGRPSTPIETRFGRLYQVDLVTGCWNWTGKIKEGRYGTIKLDRVREAYAHRVSWMLHRGDIPEGMCVCHHCDNTRCVNPDHLFIGTQPDNIGDMVSKNRQRGNMQPKNRDEYGRFALNGVRHG